MQRVVAFIDGFNLYHGLRHKHGRKYLWLDLEALVTSLLTAQQQLAAVKYFTARVRNAPDSEQRQSDYIDALVAHSTKLEVVDGRFQEKDRHCCNCQSTWTVYEEKETDVSIAVALIEAGVNDEFDVALILSADSDLCPAVRALGRLRPEKQVVAAFPPRRRSGELRQGRHCHRRDAGTPGSLGVARPRRPGSESFERASG
ncbi:NYN domain-containing protein [Amycolatopsis lurida]